MGVSETGRKRIETGTKNEYDEEDEQRRLLATGTNLKNK